MLLLAPLMWTCLQGFAFAQDSGTINSETSLTLMFQNNLNASDDVNHVGFIFLGNNSQEQQAQVCAGLGQTLITSTTVENFTADLAQLISYRIYAQYAVSAQKYLIDGATVAAESDISLVVSEVDVNEQLPAICSNSAQQSEPQNSTATPSTTLSIAAGDNKYQGYFNKKSFRFLGIRYASQPERFEYPELYTPQGEVVNATTYGAQCVQAGAGEEDCLFLNIQTPYIPQTGSKENLRPVMFWIHGGGFTGGTGADPLSDGSNLASREDIVVVTINYRLSTLGFLAVPGTNVTGNYGIADQVTALQWTVQNIAFFGGDPNKITIIGESAGAGSVRTLLGSPQAIGLYQGAVAMSNLGGGRDLDLSMNYGTSYSSYYTIEESFNVSGSQIFNNTNCTSSNLEESIDCLKLVNGSTLVGLDTVARYVVQDDRYVNTSELNVLTPRNGTAYVPTIFGVVANDGASFSNYPKTPIAEGNLTGALQVGLSIAVEAANSIIDSGLFPFYDSGNYTLDAFNVTQRVATDNTFLCVDQATIYAAASMEVFPAAYFYQVERSINGYNPNNLPGAPVTSDYPYGNPNQPYFKLHGSDMDWIFGNYYGPLRDANDLYSVQLVSSYFAEFFRTGQPNPSREYLMSRGYGMTLSAVEQFGTWDKVSSKDGPVRHLDYPSYSTGFVDVPQCAWLNYSISYYLNGDTSFKVKDFT